MAPKPAVDQGWVTSSYSSGSGECVQVKHLAAAVGVRDSKNPQGPALAFESRTWAAFLR